MKTILSNFLSKRYSIIAVIGISMILSIVDRNIGFFFGLGIVIYILRQNKWNWSIFGISEKFTLATLRNSIIISVLYFFTMLIIDSITQFYFGKHNLSSLDHIRGDFMNYSIIMLIMWLFAAFGEEILFHGYYMKGLAKLFGDTKKAWVLSGSLIALYFGISHSYQGISGTIGVTLGSLFFAWLFYKNKTNLVLLILIHGIYDSICLTLIFLNKDNEIRSMVNNLLFN